MDHTKDQWYSVGAYRVARLCAQDEAHQQALEECRQRELAFQEVEAQLTQAQRDAVGDYIASLCNLEYQTSRIAYEYGKQVGKRG